MCYMTIEKSEKSVEDTANIEFQIDCITLKRWSTAHCFTDSVKSLNKLWEKWMAKYAIRRDQPDNYEIIQSLGIGASG